MCGLVIDRSLVRLSPTALPNMVKLTTHVSLWCQTPSKRRPSVRLLDGIWNERKDVRTDTRDNNVHRDRRRHAVSTSLRLVTNRRTDRLREYNLRRPSVRPSVRPSLRWSLTHTSVTELRLRNDLYCVGLGVELYSLTLSPSAPVFMSVITLPHVDQIRQH